MKTEMGIICVPVAGEPNDAAKACASFNASFTGWYRAEVAEYESLAKRHRDEEAGMKGHIERQEGIERDLRRRVFRTRNRGVRAELSAQWNSVRRDIKTNQSHLAATKANNRAAEADWRKAFKGRLAKRLRARPAGCKVSVAD